LSFPPRIKYGINSSGPPAHRASGPEGIQIASGPEGKHWIPDQVRNDKMCKVFSEKVHKLLLKVLRQFKTKGYLRSNF
jgi:hypothetical protein